MASGVQSPVTYPTLYDTTPSTSNATLYTASAPAVVKGIYAINGTGAAATITLNLVRKGGTSSDAYAVNIAAAVSVAANSTAALLPSEHLYSALNGLQLETGDTLQGLQGTSSSITLLIIGG
jgi:hypothetical protein